jgi:hypothetical protein
LSHPAQPSSMQHLSEPVLPVLAPDEPGRMPDWVPDRVRLYLSHTEDGVSIRALARKVGLNASTVMRQVRRFEMRRDDPLMDEALSLLSQGSPPFARL